jgi:hypothetical protein
MRTHTHHNTHKRTVRICDENNVPVKKSMHLITSPPKKRYITLKIKDYKKQVSFGEFQRIKALDKKKLISTRDATKAKIKDTDTQYKNNKIVYEPEIMNKIAVLREKELRTTIYHMSKALQSKSQNLEEETLKLYEEILINIKKIFEKVSKEIEEKKIEILQRIQIRLNECDNRQRKLLEKKIAEQETILRNLHTFTYEMQRVRENYGIIKNKISNLSEKNFELEQRIKLEDQKYDKIYSLLREYKVRINNIAHTIEKYKKEEKNEKEENEKVEDIQKENKLELKNLILNNIETEYTNNKVTTTNNNNKNKSLRPNSVKESMAFNLMNKSIKQFNNKINFYENLNYQEIPDNKLYNCLIKIIDTMKNSKDYKIVSGVNNTLLSNNMKILPLQNKEFRKDFMDKLFNNYELLQAFEEGETEFVNKPFNKHLFDK